MTQQPGAVRPRVEIPVTVHDELGLHARPAARLARAAQAFAAEVHLRGEHGEADAKSILDLLSLAAGHGSRLTLVCSGEDAENAAEALRLLLEVPLMHGGA